MLGTEIFVCAYVPRFILTIKEQTIKVPEGFWKIALPTRESGCKVLTLMKSEFFITMFKIDIYFF